MSQDYINALFGGVLIGTSVSLMLYWNGRVTGISGIVSGLLSSKKGDRGWRVLFILGLLFGGLVLKMFMPHVFAGFLPITATTTALAGLLVGFGTVMGSGCTSGHGVCGISRMSLRSMIATGVFMAAGVLAVFVFKKIGVHG